MKNNYDLTIVHCCVSERPFGYVLYVKRSLENRTALDVTLVLPRTLTHAVVASGPHYVPPRSFEDRPLAFTLA